MDSINLKTSSLDRCDHTDSWRDVVSTMIHNVEVAKVNTQGFAAGIAARRHNDISCGYFWSKPHELRGGREHLSNSGSGGYLVSWQIEGMACVEQDGQQLTQAPGMVAIVDGRRPMHVQFPNDVRRIVAKFPARILEQRLPGLMARHSMLFEPTGPFASMLLAYLTELSRENSPLSDADLEPVVENIANLLQIVVSPNGLGSCDSRELRRQALLRLIKQHACDSELNLAFVANKLHVSRRLAQQMLKEDNTTFTDFVTQERLQLAAGKLMAKSDLPVSQVAYSSGFSDVSHFNHLFKQRYGMSPSEYRRSLMNRSS